MIPQPTHIGDCNTCGHEWPVSNGGGTATEILAVSKDSCPRCGSRDVETKPIVHGGPFPAGQNKKY